MFAPTAVAIQKWNFPLFGHKRDAGMGLYHMETEKLLIFDINENGKMAKFIQQQKNELS